MFRCQIAPGGARCLDRVDRIDDDGMPKTEMFVRQRYGSLRTGFHPVRGAPDIFHARLGLHDDRSKEPSNKNQIHPNLSRRSV